MLLIFNKTDPGGRWLVGIAGSNFATGDIDDCFLRMLCVVQVQASATSRSLVQGSPNVCVIRWNNNPLHVQ
jgi:hypothetical protein